MPRIIQILLAVISGILLSPVLLILLIILSLQGAVFFCQTRIGKGNRPFTLYKFRTMGPPIQGGSIQGQHRTDRITRVGRFLRLFSLDELPQLWNILRGDMNLIGPRPLPVEYLPRMNERIRSRHRVLPGITGWAQVKGRNLLSWEEKFMMDLWYVENRSFSLDLRILLLTIPLIFSKKGVDQNDFQTMEEYNGVRS